jgi:hypothetical protein
VSDEPLDGNVTAGSLAELFAFDVTVAVTTCAGCRGVRPVAELHAYVQAPGVVLRCTSCGGVQLRLVHAPNRAWLDMRGVEVLEIRLPG